MLWPIFAVHILFPSLFLKEAVYCQEFNQPNLVLHSPFSPFHLFTPTPRKRNGVHSGKKAANSFGELGPKREVILNGLKGPESDFGGSKTRTDSLGPFGSNLA